MLKLAAVLVAAFSLGGAGGPTIPAPVSFTFAVNPLVACMGQFGSGVRIDDDTVITARHVVTRGCSVEGVPAEIAFVDPVHDFAVLKGDFRPGLRATISCDGFKPGQQYLALGYPNRTPVIEMLTATTQRGGKDKARILKGFGYPGMSGGGNYRLADGAVVGLTIRRDARGFAGVASVDLADTYLCD